MNRRRFLQWSSLALAGVATASYSRFVEPRWLEVTTKTVHLTTPLTRPLRLLHLSDLHASAVVSLEYLAAAIAQSLVEKPDLICLTGDYVTQTFPTSDQYQHILQQLAAHAPTFACLGNHDGGIWAEGYGGYSDSAAVVALLTASGIRCLQNEAVTVKVQGQMLQLVGFNDVWNDVIAWSKVFEAIPPATEWPRIVLLHNPDARHYLADYAWDLLLSGHTHGGQFVLPLIDYAPFAPVQDKSFVAGLMYDAQGRALHITRGLGNLYGLRFNCRPEASHLILQG